MISGRPSVLVELRAFAIVFPDNQVNVSRIRQIDRGVLRYGHPLKDNQSFTDVRSEEDRLWQTNVVLFLIQAGRKKIRG